MWLLLFLACGGGSEKKSYSWEQIPAPHPKLVCWHRVDSWRVTGSGSSRYGEGIVCIPIDQLVLPKEQGES